MVPFKYLFLIASILASNCLTTEVMPVVWHGNNAQLGEFPHQVYLEHCAGTIIDDQHIMTAAHCVEDDIDTLNVYVGIVSVREKDLPKPIKVKLSRKTLFVHKSPHYNDIAIVRLPHKLTFSKNVRPAKLYTRNDTDLVGKTAIIIGWGATESHDESNHLLKADASIISNKRCRRYFSYLSKKEICTFNYRGSSIDSGDSGGGLVLKSTKEVIGINSRGKDLANRFPAVYVSVSKYREFIKTAVKSLSQN